MIFDDDGLGCIPKAALYNLVFLGNTYTNANTDTNTNYDKTNTNTNTYLLDRSPLFVKDIYFFVIILYKVTYINSYHDEVIN